MTAQQTLEGKDKHGSYKLILADDYICAQFVGSMSTELCQAYARDFRKLSHQLEHLNWGYVACAKAFDASTPMAHQVLQDAFAYGMQHNCIIDAYCMLSPLAKNQVDQIRMNLGLRTPTEKRMYESTEEAIEFVRDYLNNFHY